MLTIINSFHLINVKIFCLLLSRSVIINKEIKMVSQKKKFNRQLNNLKIHLRKNDGSYTNTKKRIFHLKYPFLYLKVYVYLVNFIR